MFDGGIAFCGVEGAIGTLGLIWLYIEFGVPGVIGCTNAAGELVFGVVEVETIEEVDAEGGSGVRAGFLGPEDEGRFGETDLFAEGT